MQASRDEAGLRESLARAGIAFDALRHQCQEMVVFGSRASGVGDENSDWDLLCVGDGATRRTRGLDIIWITADSVHCQAWTTSEIASHIVTYGRWIAGAPSAWSKLVEITPRTIERKVRWIRTHVDAWQRFWPRCSLRLREQYALNLRYNLQRLECLLNKEAVPPRQRLDARFAACSARVEWFEAMALASGLTGEFVAAELRPRVSPIR